MIKYIFILFMLLSIANSQENTNDITPAYNFPFPLKYGLYSAMLPGLGQFQLHRKISNKSIINSSRLSTKILNRSLYFFGIESAAVISSIFFNSKYESKKDEYKLFANTNWDFGRWIYNYENFQSTDLSFLWSNVYVHDGFEDETWINIGEGSHSIKFSMGSQNNIISTTSEEFLLIKDDIIAFYDSGGDDIYSEFDITIRADQHFYENIGKYNEFFSGWIDADTANTTVIVTEQGYSTPRSPIKTTYIEHYNSAENFSDISEISSTCIYLNHFISMIDAFVLARKYNGDVMLSSSTIYDYKNKNKSPIGITINLTFRL